MKKLILILVLAVLYVPPWLYAQDQEIKQLALNVEKLAQLKQLLSDMKKGYQVVSAGYTTIKDVSQGNFGLHQTYLDELMQISPSVKKYKKVRDIINYQMLLVQEYKQAYSRFKQDGNFNPEELAYLGQVYGNLLNKSLNHLDELSSVLTASRMRMSDDERLRAIDNIFMDMQDKLVFLRHFNTSNTKLAVQRARERNDVITIRQIYGITQ
jgi:DNA repair ATPase RecN